MAYLAVNKDGSEWIFERKPFRAEHEDGYWDCCCCRVELPDGTISKLLDRETSWDDEPVELI